MQLHFKRKCDFLVYTQLAHHTSKDIQLPWAPQLCCPPAHCGSLGASQRHIHRRTHLADPGDSVLTLLPEAAQDAVYGLPHLLLELGTWSQVVLDEGVQLLAGDL